MADEGNPYRDPAAYDRLVGRYSPELARGLIRLTGVAPGYQALDVGCGTGLLTAELAAVVGADHVTAVDPSAPFVAAARRRVPGADVHHCGAEQLPFDDQTFDHALSQLVVNFMSDPDGGVQEMRRVTRPEGTVASCVWDYVGEMTLLRAFWDAAIALDAAATAHDEGITMPMCNPDGLRALWERAGLREVRTDALRPSVRYASFDELWAPFPTGVALVGAYTISLDSAAQSALRDELYRRLGRPTGPFELSARAWVVIGRR